MKVSRRMLKYVLSAVLIVAIFIIYQSVRYRGIYVGMTYDQLEEAISEEERFQYGNYIFFKNSIGGHIVARVSREYDTITEIHCYDAWSVDSSDSSFSKIEEGMSVEEVVSIVGIPYGTATSGMFTLAFESDSGTIFVVYLNEEKTNNDNVFTVASVYLPQ